MLLDHAWLRVEHRLLLLVVTLDNRRHDRLRRRCFPLCSGPIQLYVWLNEVAAILFNLAHARDLDTVIEHLIGHLVMVSVCKLYVERVCQLHVQLGSAHALFGLCFRRTWLG